MDRASYTACSFRLFVVSLGWVTATAQLSIVNDPLARAITITMEYTDEGNPVPHDENPLWDPAGTILKAHFNRAKQIWEQLLPGPADFEFDFHWDNDIPGLGLATNVGFIDTYIEINPNYAWFADATLLTDEEFNPVGIQKLYSDLTPTEQNSFFVGNPPGALETHYQRDGLDSYTGVGGYDANDGYDLLTVILHEIGHVLGINKQVEPLYPLNPAHLGGAGVIVVGDEGHLAGSSHTPGYLMCGTCAHPGGRYYPTSTDVLAIAQENGITDVYLQRVGRISSGLWNESGAWIGADTPSFPQDAYVTHGGTVTLDANASARDLLVAGGNTVAVGSNALNLGGDLTLAAGATVSVGAGGTISAHNITRGSNDITTSAGSLVWFNSYSGGSGPTANFNGSIRIGNNGDTAPPTTFNPDTITTWTIAEEMALDSGNGAINMIIDGEADFTSAAGRIGPVTGMGTAPNLTINGEKASWDVNGPLAILLGNLTIANNGYLEANSASLGSNIGKGVAIIENSNSRWKVRDNLEVGPATFVGEGQGLLTIRNDGRLLVDGNLNIHGTPIGTSEVSVQSDGNLEVDGAINVGPHGLLAYHDSTFGYSGILGSQTINNLGGVNDQAGGVTRFMSNSIANRNTEPGTSEFTNHPGTSFFATGGSTEFRDSASAGSAKFNNLPGGTVSIYSGRTRFFDHATAGNGQFFNHPGQWTNPPTVEFNGDSSGGNGTFVNLPGVPGVSRGGVFVFNDRAKAGAGTYTTQGEGGYVYFYDSSSAENGIFTTADTIGSGNNRVEFYDNATAGLATFNMGAGSVLKFSNHSSAEDATITLHQQSTASFDGEFNTQQLPTVTAGTAAISVEGASVAGSFGASLAFNGYATAGNAVINILGGSAAAAAGGTVAFDFSGSAGNAMLTTYGGVAGAGGAQIYFRRGGNGPNAKIVNNEGGYVDFGGNFSFGGTDIGSIEGAGTFALNGSELRVGGANATTTVVGPLIDAPGFNPNGQLTKVGTGTLTLAGTNTYTGLTKVNAGAIAVDGSIVGPVQVNNGGILKGNGTIGDTVTLNAGGLLTPGNSAGGITLGGLAMMPGSTLGLEIGGTAAGSDFDQILSAGLLNFDGTLQVSLINGFAPTLGQSFKLFQWGSAAGTFDAIMLPSLGGGVSWNTSQLYTAGTLSVGMQASGDFDGDGDVDGRDFLVWQRNPAVGNLADWQAAYNGGALVAASAAVPEPQTWLLLLMVFAGCCRPCGKPSHVRNLWS